MPTTRRVGGMAVRFSAFKGLGAQRTPWWLLTADQSVGRS